MIPVPTGSLAGPRSTERDLLTITVGLAILFACLTPSTLLASFHGFTPSAGGVEETGSPLEGDQARSIVAYEIGNGEQIVIDGRLDDSTWMNAQASSGFRCWDPDRGSPVSEETVFKVAYDTDAIYFAVACLEKDPSNISKRLSRRDRFSNSDLVSIYIDPYHDHSTGYNFRVNPLGVQQDSYVFNDGNMDQDWNAVWEAETYEDDEGWYTELRIPLSSIQYRQDSPTWGLQVYRYMHGRGEDTAWVVWDRDTPGFVSRFGSLTGLRNIPAPRQLEVTPYVVARARDRSVQGADPIDDYENLGADITFGITADLTLNATVQPDFGQVEADPAVLNLSPFETFYEEKRQFFVDGSRFFQHSGFNLFYSRRIGTGEETSRIRYAAKLTGKTAGDISVAALLAETDLTEDGKTHNIFKRGSRLSRYFVSRLGKEFNQAKYKFNVMQTMVLNSGSPEDFGDMGSREAYASGADFSLLFGNRKYSVEGSFVGSIIDPEPDPDEPIVPPTESYGTGGLVAVGRRGTFQGQIYAQWKTANLDLNDVGFLSSADEYNSGIWLGYRYNPEGTSERFNQGNLNFNLDSGWLYSGRTGYDLHTGEKVWSYSGAEPAYGSGNINGWFQLRSYREFWFGIAYNAEGSKRYESRSTVVLQDGDEEVIPGGGPLVAEPPTYGGWLGINTDSRKDFVFSLDANYWPDVAENHTASFSAGLQWNQSCSLRHDLHLSYRVRHDDTQHIENFENTVGGIGGVSYVFGKIDQKTIDVTLRSNVLFSRTSSLEIYTQPYLTIGDYSDAKELRRPDSYDFIPYAGADFRVEDNDFRYASLNVNVVFRWEYRPGSTLYLVWTHSRETYDERADSANPSAFRNDLESKVIFKNEPENVFLAKITYWLPI